MVVLKKWADPQILKLFDLTEAKGFHTQLLLLLDILFLMIFLNLDLFRSFESLS